MLLIRLAWRARPVDEDEFINICWHLFSGFGMVFLIDYSRSHRRVCVRAPEILGAIKVGTVSVILAWAG